MRGMARSRCLARWAVLAGTAWLASSCGDPPSPGTTLGATADDGGTGSGTTGGDGSESTGASSATVTSTGDGDGDDATTGDGDGTSGDGDGDGACSETAMARFWIDPPVASLSETCAVTDVTTIGPETLYTFDCSGTTRTVGTVTTLPSPGLYAGLDVRVEYRTAAIGPNEDRWLAIHDDVIAGGVMRLGLVAATALSPPGLTVAEFFAPLDLREIGGSCDAFDDMCGLVDPRVLEISDSADPTTPFGTVPHGGSFFADFLAYGWSIEVEAATRRIAPTGCDDVPETWFQLAAKWFVSD